MGREKTSKHWSAVKERIFIAILWIATFIFILTAMVNILNKRPVENVIFPVVGALIVVMFIKLFQNKIFVRGIKSVFLFFICVIYLPAAWLTSPGSYSAMSFYVLVVLFTSIVLIERPWEYVFPVLVVIETIVLLFYEATNPVQYALYTTPELRAIDLVINFVIASAFFFVVIGILNTFFENEHKRIFSASITDPLTGVYNRRYLYQILEGFESHDASNSFALIMMDLNNFKKVNDTYGHTVGDDVLKAFSKCLIQASRKIDYPIRYGGDEFVLIAIGASISEAEQIEQRINMLFEPVCETYKDVGLSVSFGFSGSENQSVDDIIKKADDLLYKNKLMR